MSLIEASEDRTPSTAPIETFVAARRAPCEIRSARTPLSSSAARAAGAKDEDREDQRRQTADGNETPHHQKACPMLT